MRQEAALFVEGDVTDKDQRDPTNAGVVYNSVLTTGSEQFTGSIAGDLSAQPSVRRRARISPQGSPHWNFGSIFQHESNGLVVPGVSTSTYDHMANSWRFGDVPLYALESLFKLRDKRCFTRLETIASFDTPEKIAAWLRACVVHY